MTIKGLLIGSAAAIVAVSGAQAADAIVAAEPEAVEYVRVCDAFGAGFFYIPGSETCLKVGGYVRTQYNFSKDRLVKTEDANTWSRAQLTLDARNETDLGTLRSFFVLRGQPDAAADKSAVWVEEAFFEVAGLRAGKFFSIWDNGLSGDTDVLSSNALFNAARYTYDAGAFVATIAAEELQFTVNNVTTHNVGFTASAAAALAGVKFEVVGGYDLENEEGAVRAIATTQVGPGVLGASAAYATGANAYFAAAEWTVAAEYAVNVTEKLKVTPGVQYFADYNLTTADAWKAGVTADYAITSGLAAKAHVDYTNVDAAPEAWSGFVRVTRSF